MNLRTLKYFVAIADAGSSPARQPLFPSRSRRSLDKCAELEAELGAQLLDPAAGGLPRPAPTFSDASARRILANFFRVREKLARSQFAGKAAVTIGVRRHSWPVCSCPTSCRPARIPWRALSSGAGEAFTPVLLEWLERGVIDMAVVTNPGGGRALSYQPF